MTGLAGQVAVVTGAGAGIGRAVADVLAERGCRVAVIDADPGLGNRAVDEIRAAGDIATFVHADVTLAADVSAMREAVLQQLGSPTILVNNVGWDRVAHFVETTPEHWYKVVELNFMSTLSVTHAFFGAMVENGSGGSVVNIASEAGRVGSKGQTVYSGAKGGVISFTKALALEGAQHGITVNCVCPGMTETRLLREQPTEDLEARTRSIPMRRLAQPADIAAAVAFFASPEASYVTGQVLSVSGGLTTAG